MDEVQIGRGKRARRAYGLDDVTLVPTRRTRDPHDVDLSWKIDAYRFDLPVMAAGLDAPTDAASAASARAAGALVVVDLEAWWDELGDRDAVMARVAEARGEARLAVSIGPRRVEELVPVAVASEAQVLVIRDDVLSADHVSSGGDADLRSLVRSIDLPVVVGGCVSQPAARHLMRTGAAGVLVGSHRPGPGVDVPLATAIADVRAARLQHLDETGVYCHLIAAGPIADGVDAAKAIAVGADAVLVDASLAADTARFTDPLRDAMATCGYTSVKSFQSAEVVVR